MNTAILSTEEVPAPPLAAKQSGASHPLILLVDDDARTRRFVRAVVAYAMARTDTVADVIEAADSSAAHSSARKAGRSIDLLITDLRLGPGKSGVDLARDLSSTNPRMRILLMSGSDVYEKDLPDQWHFLAKPVRVSDLVELIVLDRKASPAPPASQFADGRSM